MTGWIGSTTLQIQVWGEGASHFAAQGRVCVLMRSMLWAIACANVAAQTDPGGEGGLGGLCDGREACRGQQLCIDDKRLHRLTRFHWGMPRTSEASTGAMRWIRAGISWAVGPVYESTAPLWDRPTPYTDRGIKVTPRSAHARATR